MTIATAIIILLLACILFGTAASLVVAQLKPLAARLGEAETAFDEMYASAQTLIKDPTVPMIVVEFIGYLSHEASRGRLARRIALDIITGDMVNDDGEQRGRSREFAKALGALEADQAAAFAHFVGYALKSSALSGVLLGPFVDNILTAYLSETGRVRDRTVSQAKAVAAASDASSHWNGQACPAAA